MKKIRVSRVNEENATLISSLKQIADRASNKLKVNNQKLSEIPTKRPRENKKNRVENSEAIYAEPAPRRCQGPISAEENLQDWGMRRGLPINKIRIIAAELRKSS